MSFLCNFPIYSKTVTPLDTDFSISLPSKKKKNIPQSTSHYSNEKEIRFNDEEQEKVIYIKNAESFELNLQVSGTTILQNLVLTAKGSHNGNNIPIKCQWRRFKSESERKNIKNNSLSYMPNSEDIGFSIEVEVESLDNINDIAIARYGPISLSTEIENIITELISYEKRTFNLKSCNDKINSNFILSLHKKEIKLIKIEQNGKKTVIERCKYSKVNPSLELSNTNMTKFKISFIQFSNDNIGNNNDKENSSNNSNNISFYTEVDNEDIFESELKVKNEYEFFANSKQSRELIYLIIQFNAINIKISKNKIFRPANYNTFSQEIKNGIFKLIGDLKIHKEQNTIMLKNIKYLEYVNQQLIEESNVLEENCKITMNKINGRDPNYDDINKNINSNKSNLNEEDWKNKIEELNINYNTLLAKEKAINEEKVNLINKNSNNLKLIEQKKKKL